MAMAQETDMGFSKADKAFADVAEAFDRALKAPRGIRITCDSRGEAVVLRTRFNYYRKLDRNKNRETYDADHPLHHQSIYDGLVLSVPAKGNDDQNILYIRPRLITDLVIEEITEEASPPQ